MHRLDRSFESESQKDLQARLTILVHEFLYGLFIKNQNDYLKASLV